MKIGILTFHRAHNYGALLQCYALQQVLLSMGHNAYVIDYRQPYIEKMYGLKIKRVLKRIFFPARLKKYLRSISKYTSFYKFFNLTSKCNATNIPENFDAYIIGSDQLWSLDCTNGVDPVYTGNFRHKKDARIIGFSISVNSRSLHSLSDDILQRIVTRFNAISFREQFALDYVSSRVGKSFYQTLDPTLLADALLWKPLLNHKFDNEKYVLLYEVRRLCGRENTLLEKAERLAQEKKMNVVNLSEIDCTVADFVTAFSKAEYVITSSFHASAFALIFQKPLCAFLLQDGNDNRYKDLLESIGAGNFLYSIDDDIVDNPNADYQLICNRLDQIKQNSLEFLMEAFG